MNRNNLNRDLMNCCKTGIGITYSVADLEVKSYNFSSMTVVSQQQCTSHLPGDVFLHLIAWRIHFEKQGLRISTFLLSSVALSI